MRGAECNTLSKGIFLCLIGGMLTDAQGASDDPLVMDEIIVTAQKRAQTAQDVGISIATFSGDQIKNLSIDSVTDVAAFVPGVNLSGSFAGQLQTFSIRGVTQNDVLDHTEAPSTVYLDEGYIAALNGQGLALFDIEQVEVLKGPQGTLFGRNATGGAVTITTRKPSFDETEGFAHIRYANYADYNQIKTETAIGGPLSDTLATRIAATYTRQGDYYNNLFPGGEDLGSFENWGVRAHVLFQPMDQLTVLFTGHSAQTILDTPPYQSLSTRDVLDANGFIVNSIVVNDATLLGTIDPDGTDFDILHDFSANDINTLEQYGATLKIEWEQDNITLTAITDYKDFHKEFFLDADVTEVAALITVNLSDTDNFSQEIRIFFDDGALRSYFGLYYLYIRSDIPSAGIILPQDGISILDDYRLQTNSYSVFSQLEYDIADQVTLIGGLRLTKEDKKFDYFSPARDPFEDTSSQTLISAKAQLDYRLMETTLLFASYNRGVKAGSFNAPFGGSNLILDADIPYDEEVLNAFELGFKASLFDKTAQLNGSVFYYDYQDYQAFQLLGITTQVINSDAEFYGAELELNSHLSRDVSLFLSLAYLNTNVEDVNFNGVIADREASFSPEFSASAILKYEFDALNGLFTVQAEANYNSEFFFALSNFDATEIQDYLISNVRLAYETYDQHWRVSAFLENLTDKRNETIGFDLSSFCGCSEIAFGPPRTLGITLEYRFY